MVKQQLKSVVAFAFEEGVAKYLIGELKAEASRLEGRISREERAAMQHKHASSKTQQPDDLKSMRRPQTPSATKEAMPLADDAKLDLLAFATLVREREGVDVEDELIKKVFAAFDKDGNGTVSAHEYLLYSLVEALASTEMRALDLFKQWDEDASGCISEGEFLKAVQVLGFAVPRKVASLLFRQLDVDRSGFLKYSELGRALSTRIGAEASKAELARYAPGGQQANRDNRLGKIVARDSTNYASVRVRALPAGAKLDASSGGSIAQQLGALLTEHSATIIRLFQDWDEDGNGGVSKAEFRRAVKGLGYAAPNADIDELFGSLQGDNSGATDMADYLEIEELHKALHGHVRGSKHTRAVPPVPPPVEMPLEIDTSLDLLQFAQLARSREGDDLDDDHIQIMFAAFDEDGSGMVSAHEYLVYSLREACVVTGKRMVELFKQWDDDRSGEISEREFKQAVRVLGFSVPDKVATMLFHRLDVDGNKVLKYSELVDLLSKPNPGVKASRAEIMRYTPGGQRGNRDNRLGRPSARDSYNFETIRVRALPANAKLDPESDMSMAEQLGLLLSLHEKTVTNLLRDWDEDGNGGVDKKEFRRALASLGYSASRETIDDLFDDLDVINKDGFLAYDEMHQALRKYIRPKNAPGGSGVGGGLGGQVAGSGPLGQRTDGRSRLAKLQEAKMMGARPSSRPSSRSATKLEQLQAQAGAEWQYSRFRPSTAEWKPKRHDFVMDFKARWPYA